MRFPRALSIRDDLGIEDCMTASGLFPLAVYSPLTQITSAVLETMRAERKRKMGKDARYALVALYFLMTIALVTASTIERKKEKS